MQLVIHPGMPKCGSTSIQRALRDAKPRLAREGVVVPRFGRNDSHEVLTLASKSPEWLPVSFPERIRDEGDRRALLDHYVEGIVEEIRACPVEPSVVVMSSEYAFHVAEEQAGDIRDLAQRIGASSVRCIVYVRDPASRYKSFIQQRVRRLNYIPSPDEMQFLSIEMINRFEKFVADEMIVRPFDHSQLVRGDIVADFFRRAGIGEPDGGRSYAENLSLSAEGAVLMQRYAETFHRGRADGVRTLDMAVVQNALPKRIGGTKLSLKQETKSYIEYRFADDIRSFRDDYGVVFSGVDYEFPGGSCVSESNRIGDHVGYEPGRYVLTVVLMVVRIPFVVFGALFKRRMWRKVCGRIAHCIPGRSGKAWSVRS